MSASQRASLERRVSSASLFQSQAQDVPSGPLSGPSSTRWRRNRLLSIGTERSEPEENAPLSPDSTHTNYGTISNDTRPKRSKSKLNTRRGITSLQGLAIPNVSFSTPVTPGGTSPISFVEQLSYLRERPISAYDKHNYVETLEPGTTEGDIKTNGIRVWYSSFTSIDWLHDTIKGSARQARLRRRKSYRGKLRRWLDRSIGWVVVSIVGFLTAIIAFLITRSEQWLFDFKEGYCEWAWYNSKRFCCPTVDDNQLSPLPAFLSSIQDDECPGWRPWSEVFGPTVDGSSWLMFESEMIEYIAYTAVAVSSIVLCYSTFLNLSGRGSLHGPSFHAFSPLNLPLRRRSKLARTLVCFPQRLLLVTKRARLLLVNPKQNVKSCTMYV